MTNLKPGDRVHVEFDAEVMNLPEDDFPPLPAIVKVIHTAAVDLIVRVPTAALTRIAVPKVGPFDPGAQYPEGTIVVNDVQGGAHARMLGGVWRTRNVGVASSAIQRWEEPLVVYVPES